MADATDRDGSGTGVAVGRLPVWLFRGQRVLLDRDVAVLFGVRTGALNQAVKRRASLFPETETFYLDADEMQVLREREGMRGRGGNQKATRVFTERGVWLVSTVLRSPRAEMVVRLIVEVFVRVRALETEHTATNFPEPILVENDVLPALVAGEGPMDGVRRALVEIGEALGDPALRARVFAEARDLLDGVLDFVKGTLQAPSALVARQRAEAERLLAEAELARARTAELRAEQAGPEALEDLRRALESAERASEALVASDLRAVLQTAATLSQRRRGGSDGD
ncbi:MAG: ORF6N domain-containing protein [Pseudomonadota bacterium]